MSYPANHFARRWSLLLTVICFLIPAVALQWRSGTYRIERGSYPDEAAHFVTSVMVRDYLVSGFNSSPIQFAKEFYIHYPKVAFGMWPPLLHFALGVWMIPAAHSHSAALLLMALIAALVAAQLYRALLPTFGVLLSGAVGILFLSLPVIQDAASAIMADMCVALFAFLVALRTARFIQTGSNRDGIILGLYAGLACMSKGNGLASILCIGLVVGLTRRFDLLRRPGLYFAAVITLVLGGPWEALSLHLFRANSSFETFGWSFTFRATTFYSTVLFHSLGLFPILLIVTGIVLKIPAIFRDRNPFWTAMMSLPAATFIFHSVLPQITDGRYMIAAIPALLAFIPVTFHWISRMLTVRRPAQIAIISALWIMTLVASPFRLPEREPMGYRETAQWLAQQADFGGKSPVMVVSDANGEGALIAEILIYDQRPQHFVLRASKIVASSDWNGNHYRLVFNRTEEILEALERLGVRYLVLDRTDPASGLGMAGAPHHTQMAEMATSFPSHVQRVQTLPLLEGHRRRSIEIYRLPYAFENDRDRIRYGSPYTFGKEMVEGR